MRESFHPNKNISNNAFVMGLTTPTLIFVITLIINSCSYPESKKFDSNHWKDDPKSRFQMVENIIDSKLLLGLNKEKVIELLGSDTEDGPCDNCIGYATYNPDQGFSIDHEVLEINFDNQNNVTDVRIDSW